MHNAVNAQTGQTKTDESEGKKTRKRAAEESVVEGSRVETSRSQGEQRTGKPTSQPASQLSRRPIANREAMTLARG